MLGTGVWRSGWGSRCWCPGRRALHGEVVALHGKRGVLREDELGDDGGFAHVLRGPVFMHGQTEDRRTLLKSWP